MFNNYYKNRTKSKNFDNSQSGFTLIELLVSMAIFAMSTVILSGIYIAFSQTQLRTNASQVLLNNAQYVMEIMAREIRNGELFDYDSLTCDEAVGYDSCIILVRESGEFIGFVSDDISTSGVLEYVLFTCDGSPCSTDSETGLLGATLNNVEVNSLDFFINPNTNPFPSADVNEQPRVTIKLEVSFPSTREIEQVSYSLQTTVSSRIYKR